MYVILSISTQSTNVERSFIISYFEDSWVLPKPFILVEENGYVGMCMHLSMANIAYQSIQLASTDIDFISSSWEEFGQFSFPIWASKSNLTLDSLDMVLPSEKEILESMVKHAS
jgi:hypothetical protein